MLVASGVEARDGVAAVLPHQIIGIVQTAIGYATLTRDGGIATQVSVGDPVCHSDIIEAAADGQVGILLIDDTVFNVSSGARIELSECVCQSDGTARSIVLSVDRGSFAFAAGRLAENGTLTVDTPLGSVRARSYSSGFGILTLAALTFSMMPDANAADPDATFLDDDKITYKDMQHGVFELITKEAVPRHIIVEDPGETVILNKIGSSVSVSQVANSAARMEELQAAQQDVLANLTHGPTGSGTPPFVESLPVEPINFVPEDEPAAPNVLPPLPSFVIPILATPLVRPPPTLAVPAGPIEIDTITFDQFSATTGTFTASSAAIGAVLTYGLSGGTSGNTTLNGVTYNLSQTGPYGTLYLNSASGAYAFVPNNDAINALQSPTTTGFVITVSDGSLSVSQTFTIDINGANDAAIISGNAGGAVAEAGGAANAAPGTPTATGTLTDTDVDNPANTFTAVSSPTKSTGGYGTFTMTTAGAWTYSVDNTNHAVQALNVGDTLTDTFTVTSIDGTPKVVTITIQGSNDAAVISGATVGSVVEASSASHGSSVATGTLVDADVDNPPNTFVAIGSPTASAGGYGSFTITADGAWTYTLDNANCKVQALNIGDTLTDSFTVNTIDGTPQVVTITINGSNDPAVIYGCKTGVVIEAGCVANQMPGRPTATGTLTDIDPDNPPNTFTAVSSPKPSAGGFGTFTMTASGVWTYTLDNNNSTVQALNVCDTLTDKFTVTTIDGTPQVVTITIRGTNDAAVIFGDTTGSVLEAGCISPGKPVATGALSDTDVDNPSNTFTAVTCPTASDCGYGTFTMTAAGVWTYTLDNSNCVVDALDDGDTLTDHFTVMTIDGTRQEVTITIHGASDGGRNDFDNLATGHSLVSDSPSVQGALQGDNIAGDGNIAQTVYGDTGDETLNGTGVNGGSSNDAIKGNNADDVVYGPARHTIDGNTDNDSIIGRPGADKLIGSNGNDVFVFQAAADSSGGRSDTINGFVSGSDKIDLTAVGALGFVVLALNSTHTPVPAHTIAWLYNSSANETVVFVNPTDQSLHIGDSSLLEIHLQGIATIASSDFIVDSNAASAIAMGDAIDPTATTQADATTVTVSTSDAPAGTTDGSGAVAFDGSSTAQAAGVHRVLSAEQGQVGSSDHPTSSNSDGIAKQPILLEPANVSPSTNSSFVFEQTGTTDSNHQKGNGPAGTGVGSHSILDVSFGTPSALPAADQHADSGKAAEADGSTSAPDTESALDPGPSNWFENGGCDHWFSRQANEHSHDRADAPGLLETQLHSKAHGGFGSEANPHEPRNSFNFLNPGCEKSSITFVNEFPASHHDHEHAAAARGHDAAPDLEASYPDGNGHHAGGWVNHPVPHHDLIV
ncbi:MULTISPECIES: VCBS domain-containing protein [unclassified Bradyrhizobium]|uniref:VCBS domain-containing protein n=1 Tax=unclassified Bradyrhizobium TaxID=2631580 RepID=UPI002478CCD8|nr:MULTISPECIES: VCBS domain-containing protein [unclassified Bradyrhizobium]WGR69832.1 VCBS domain-containing protein [Bradyrhizobium sp. ISRA426]WGR81888.1 VCBS domain-containing protein [Bradyrhizobium sp. ISRA430]WGR85074.1 VCBS domain-containing protein [Bradyrhizobium sp. ISRA432]